MVSARLHVSLYTYVHARDQGHGSDDGYSRSVTDLDGSWGVGSDKVARSDAVPTYRRQTIPRPVPDRLGIFLVGI